MAIKILSLLDADPAPRRPEQDSFKRLLQEAKKRRGHHQEQRNKTNEPRRTWMADGRAQLLRKAASTRISSSDYYPVATPANVDGKFRVGKVRFDNVDGLGNTPMGQEISYRGAVAWIKPSTFFKLAAPADRSAKGAEFEELIKKGEALACPFLIITVEGMPAAPQDFRVDGHEGRARMIAIRDLNGDVPTPVQFHFTGLRARHLSKEFLVVLESVGIQAEKSTVHVQPKADRYILDGKSISMN